MANSDSAITTPGSSLNNLINSSSSATTGTQKKSNSAVSKDEFLQMLVTQLKNQDPMDPMKSDQFAVNLAQFSQLEQLVNINNTLSAGDNGGMSSMAAYLGREISYSADYLEVKNHDGGRVRFNLGSDAKNVRVELLGADGSVAEKIDLGQASAGKHSAILSGLQTASGEYKVRVIAQGLNGQESEVTTSVAGVVTGFIPGADPVLLVGDRQVKPVDITEVNMDAAASEENRESEA